MVSRNLMRQAAYGAVLVLLIAAFGLLRETMPWASALFALGAGATVVIYVMRSDEVERALALQAGAAAFALLLAAAIVLRALGQTGVLAAGARDLWAVMIVAYLVCWIVLRIRLG